MNYSKTVVAATALAACATAFAHPGHAGPGQLGVVAGLLHPLTGVDHLLAMLGAGAWASQQRRGGRTLAAVFLCMMALGASAGASGMQLAWTEGGIVISVAALGVLLAALARCSFLPGAALLGTFAVLHGNAHGAELPLLSHALGYLTASAVLLGAGFMLGARRSPAAIRVAGAGLVAAGVALAAL